MIWYFNRKKIQTRSLLQLGYLAVIGFWLMTFISGYIHGHYNHFKNTISELGAIGTTSEMFTSSSLVFISLLTTLFSIAFYRASKEKQLSVVPAILSFAMPVTLIWAGIFTLGNEFHTLTGPLPFLIIFCSLLAYLLWKKDRTFLRLRIFSLLSFFIMTLILLRFITPFGNEYEGLVQRFFYFGWTVWTISITYFFSKTKEVVS